MKEIQVAEQEVQKENTRNVDYYKKKEFFSHCGIAITAEGQLIKSKMFDFLQLDPEEYGYIVLTAEDARRVDGRLIGVKWGGAAAKVPLMCGGEEICPFVDDCPFVEIGKVPVARKCPIEVELIAYWTAKYMEEFGVDPDNQSEVSMITELAELDIYDCRCSMILSQPDNAELTQQIVVGVDAEGRAIYNEDVHKAWELKERVKKRKDKILEALVGTRKEKYRRDAALKKRSEEDPSTKAAELKRELDESWALDAAAAIPVSEESLDVGD